MLQIEIIKVRCKLLPLSLMPGFYRDNDRDGKCSQWLIVTDCFTLPYFAPFSLEQVLPSSNSVRSEVAEQLLYRATMNMNRHQEDSGIETSGFALGSCEAILDPS